MRLGVLYDPTVCPYYRAIEPMRAMERRGHEVVWPGRPGETDLDRFKIHRTRLARCDVIHIYRIEMDHPVLSALAADAPLVYDHDDDIRALAKSELGVKAKLKADQVFRNSVKVARMAHTFTTTTAVIGDLYRKSGVERVEILDNYLAPHVDRSRRRHTGLVVGWIAGQGHQEDVKSLDLDGVLARLLKKHPDVRVECVGVDLALTERYRHEPWVPFEELPRRIGGYDIGLAPVTDKPVNQARSSIKVKEYASFGVPWLASPVGGYAALGPEHGGQLVPDDGWFDALDWLISHKRDRKRLAKHAKRWANTQMIDDFADRWERVFASAQESAAALG